jgi:hypothetical protein
MVIHSTDEKRTLIGRIETIVEENKLIAGFLFLKVNLLT